MPYSRIAVALASIVVLAVVAAPAEARVHHHHWRHHHRHHHRAWGCRWSSLAPTSHNVRRLRAATICLVNRERVQHGERRLRTTLRVGEWRQRACNRANHGRGYTIGENTAWGTGRLSTPRAIVRAWMASPGHRANILHRRYRLDAVGVRHWRWRGMTAASYTQDFCG